METSQVFQAISAQNEEQLLKLLDDPDSKEDFSVRDATGKTLLHQAVAKLRSVAAFKALLPKVDFCARDEDGNTAIDLALDDEDFPDEVEDVIKDFMQDRVLASKKSELETMLMRGWLDIWLKEGEKVPDDKDDDVKQFLDNLSTSVERVQSLHIAVKDSQWDKVKELLADGTLLGAEDRTGLPALHKAVILAQTTIAENIAKEFKDTLSITDHMGRTALHYAAGQRDAGLLYKVLTDAGASDDVKDLNGKTPKEIYENPDLLPGKKVYEKLKAKLDGPVRTSKKKKQQQQTTEQGEATTSGTEQGEVTAAGTEQAEATQTTQTTEQEAKPESPKPQTQSPKPQENKLVQMYISPDVRPNPPPTTVDGKYVADNLGVALTMALAEISELRPWDPIEYLAHWLYKYQQNADYNKTQKDLLSQIRVEEKVKEQELEIRERRKKEIQEIQQEEKRRQQAEEEERKRKEQEELHRKAKEAALSQQPGLETVMEDKEEDETPKERSHKDEKGQTELHKLAAQTGSDLTTLLNMGYSPAERDANNKTARDIAVEANIRENVEAIDKYVQKLVEMEEFDSLQDLLLAGYDKFDVVQDILKEQSTGLPEETQKFMKDLPDLQEKITAVFKAVQTEGMRDLNQALEQKKLACAKDVQGRSPLHIAVLVGHKEAVEHLASNFPITMKCKDNLERTPLHYAMAVSEDLTEVLKKHGADTLVKDVCQRSPSFYKDNPDDIKAMKGSLASLQSGSSGESQQETSQQETSQQEVSETQKEAADQEPATQQQQE